MTFDYYFPSSSKAGEGGLEWEQIALASIPYSHMQIHMLSIYI